VAEGASFLLWGEPGVGIQVFWVLILRWRAGQVSSGADVAQGAGLLGFFWVLILIWRELKFGSGRDMRGTILGGDSTWVLRRMVTSY
jgi:hypothetical protein